MALVIDDAFLPATLQAPRVLQGKMREYLANGAQLGWLIDPENRSVTVYRPNQEPETVAGIDSIAGEGPVAGFVLDLAAVWNIG